MALIELERLESIVRSAPAASGAEARYALERIEGHLLHRLSHSSPESKDAFVQAFRVLKRIKGTANAATRIASLKHCFVFHFHHSDFKSAFEAASVEYELARQMNSLDGCMRALNSMGTAQGERGNLGQALIHYSDALNVGQRDGIPEVKAIVLNNMGTALNYASLYRDAIPCFRTVISLETASWQFGLPAAAKTNLAQSYYYLEQFDEALDVIREVLAADDQATNARQHFAQALREFTMVQISLELNRVDLAMKHTKRCTHHARCANSSSRKLMADVATARCEVRIGNAQSGIDALDRLVEKSTQVDSMYKDVLVAAVQANDEAGHTRQALDYLELLLEHTKHRRMSGMRTLLEVPSRASDPVMISSNRKERLPLEYKHAELRMKLAERQAISTKWEMFERLAITADLKEDASGEHGYRVGRLSALLSERLGWSSSAVATLESAATLHDIGKVGVPDRILSSSESLKDGERTIMKMHTVIGAEMLGQSDMAELRAAESIARYHHEWWDGTGYPERLRGKRIPVQARIVALADVFDALTHGRPFAPAWTVDFAMDEIRSRRGVQFDPEMVDVFLGLIGDMRSHHQDLDRFLSKKAASSPFLNLRKHIRSMLAGEGGGISVDAAVG